MAKGRSRPSLLGDLNIKIASVSTDSFQARRKSIQRPSRVCNLKGRRPDEGIV
jgi:hypothetical protein